MQVRSLASIYLIDSLFAGCISLLLLLPSLCMVDTDIYMLNIIESLWEE